MWRGLCVCHASFIMGIAYILEYGGREASTSQSINDAPYLKYHISIFRAQIYTMPHLEETGRLSVDEECSSPVSLQIMVITSHCLRTDDIWLSNSYADHHYPH